MPVALCSPRRAPAPRGRPRSGQNGRAGERQPRIGVERTARAAACRRWRPDPGRTRRRKPSPLRRGREDHTGTASGDRHAQPRPLPSARRARLHPISRAASMEAALPKLAGAARQPIRQRSFEGHHSPSSSSGCSTRSSLRGQRRASRARRTSGSGERASRRECRSRTRRRRGRGVRPQLESRLALPCRLPWMRSLCE